MSCILHIESSTNVCSVALSQDGVCLFEKSNTEGLSHATTLAPFVEEALSFADSHAIPVDAVAVSQGPGSYTGLRIGVSTAKGVCYGRNIPLLSISTLELLAVPILLYHEEIPDEALLCPMIDARRMEVYSAVYDRALRPMRNIAADIVDENTYRDLLEQGPIYFFGNGAAKCKEVLQHPNAHILNDIVPEARYMFPLAERKLAKNQTENTAYFEPFYLKEFVATQSKKLL